MTTKEFLRSPVFRNHFLVSVGLSFILILIVFFSLRIITQHNQTIEVPDLRGKTVNASSEILGSLSLRLEVIDSVFVGNIPKGSVYEQIPEPGSLVKSDRKILLIINAFGKEKVKMPFLTGISLRQAQTILTNSGLRLGSLKYTPDIAVNNVLKQYMLGKEIKPGTLIEKNSVIDLVIGQGLSTEKTKVPYLIGLDLATARDRISSRYLNLGAAIFDETVLNSSDSSAALIWKQIPSRQFGEELFLGSPIDIWLTTDPQKLVVDSALFNQSDSLPVLPQ